MLLVHDYPVATEPLKRDLQPESEVQLAGIDVNLIVEPASSDDRVGKDGGVTGCDRYPGPRERRRDSQAAQLSSALDALLVGAASQPLA
jgi:hypothetical protein